MGVIANCCRMASVVSSPPSGSVASDGTVDGSKNGPQVAQQVPFQVRILFTEIYMMYYWTPN